MNATERKVALAHFARAGEPERGDALWGCVDGHNHHTRTAAERCGQARLEWISDTIARNIEACANLEPRIMTVVAGVGDIHKGDVIAA